MASLQHTITSAFAQLRDLTLSQRVAIVLGVVLVGGSLGWLAQWAATPEMVPLLDQPLSGEEVAQLRSGLELLNEKVSVEGSKVMVRSGSNRSAIMAQLQQMDKLPSDTSLGFAAMVKDSNPWLPQEENQRRWTVALKSELERVLGALAGVKQAHVFLNLNARERSFARNSPESKASVTLIMKSGERVSRTLALAAARLVSGAVRGLPLRNVEVVDGAGVSALEWEEEQGSSAPGLHRLQKQLERDIAGKIREQLSFDRDLRVNVQVVLDHSSRTEASTTPTEGVPVEENSSETTMSRGGRSGQPGVEPNVGAAVSAGSSDETSKTETREAKLQPGVTSLTTSNPAGSTKQVFAAINVSHSYLAGIFKRTNADAKEPTEAQIQQVFEVVKPRIEAQAAKLVMPPDPKQVAVNWYYDVAESDPAAPPAALDSTLDLARQYAAPSVLGLLALVSLGAMLRLARSKGGGESFGLEIGLPKEAIDAAQRAAADIARHGSAAARAAAHAGGDASAAMPGDESAANALPVGRASETVLEAREVNESDATIGRMVEQVESVVKEDEESVANLVEKWMDSAKWQ